MKDDTKVLNKILTALYVIIGLLLIVTVVNVMTATSSGSTAKTPATTEETSGEYDVSMFTEVTEAEVLAKAKSKTLQLVYLGRSNCGYCVQFLPTLQQAQKDYNYTTLYLDITKVDTKSDEHAKLIALDKYVSENYGYTPMVLLLKDGKYVDGWVGYAEYKTYAEWLEKNGFEK